MMSATYEIVAAGTASAMVRAAFEEFEISPVNHDRIMLVGTIPDEAALHGVLHRLQDLGLSIIEMHLVRRS